MVLKIKEIYREVIKNKKYRIFPKNFIEKIIKRNINKKNPVKKTRKDLREVYLMYEGLRKEEEVEDLIKIIYKTILIKKVKILDLGCGEFPLYLETIEKYFKIISYTGVDISRTLKERMPKKVKFIVDDLIDPKKDWTNQKYDIIFLFNLIPVIEKLEKNSGKKLLNKIKKIGGYIVISFPLYSISKRRYIGHYWKKWVNENLDKEKILFSHENKEIVFILKCFS